MTAAGASVRLGLLGKLPAHGDFVRRGSLPASFCTPWDAWLQEGIAAARARIGEARWESVWDAAPAWRFALPAGACGPDAAAGVLLPSRDSVGRRFPLTIAAVREGDGADWPAAWFATVEGIGRAALASEQRADAVAALLPQPDATPFAATPEAPGADPLAAFWASIEAENRLSTAMAAESSAAEMVAGERSESEAAAGETPDAAAAAGTASDTARGDRETIGTAADAGETIDTAPVAGESAGGAGSAAPAPETEATPPPVADLAERVGPGWWTAMAADGTPGLVWPLPALPATEEFVLLLESEA